MGKKGSSKKAPVASFGPQMSATMREASTGKKHTNVKSLLKLEHIKNLAVWASRDAAIPSLAAFFGHHFSASSEALGTPVDPSLFTCQRCETILQPGYNCTIRVEKTKTNARRKGTKATQYPQNNIVYTCHFCSHRNMKRGTPSRPKTKPRQMPRPPTTPTAHGQKPVNMLSSRDTTKDNVVANTITDDPRGKMGIVEITETLKVKEESTATPLTLLESKMRKRNRSGVKKTATSPKTEESVKISNRRRRKSWSSLKEIAESNDRSARFVNLTVPFSMQ